MQLTSKEGREIVYGEHADWETVSGTEHVISNGRWSVTYRAVFKHEPSGRHYSLVWSVGATEGQDEQAFEYSEPYPIEVHQVEKTITTWEPKS